MTSRRMIDPRFWESESTAKLTIRQRLLFIGLISNADDQGRLKAHPTLIRNKIFPFDDIPAIDIETDLKSIEDVGSIQLYEIKGTKYLQLLGWWLYQFPQWAYPSLIPAPPEWVDRLRYRKDNRIITENWEGAKVKPIQPEPDPIPDTLPEALPKALPKSEGKPVVLGIGIEIESRDSAAKNAADPPKKVTKQAGIQDLWEHRHKLRDYFCEITRLTPPKTDNHKSAQILWWTPLDTIYSLRDKDIGAACELIEAAIRELDREQLTISDPNSIVKTARSIHARNNRTPNENHGYTRA